MPIPKLNGKGVLPPINGEPYPTTSLELCQRYGHKPERRAVLRGLLGLRAAMRELQFDGGWQWVAGEFLEDDHLHPKPPNIIKVVSFCKTPDCFTPIAPPRGNLPLAAIQSRREFRRSPALLLPRTEAYLSRRASHQVGGGGVESGKGQLTKRR